MMKRFFSFALFFILVFLMSALVFAADLQTDTSIYASPKEVATIKSCIKNTLVTKTLNEFEIELDSNTIMPVYYASLYDYAETGKLECEPFLLNEKQLYVSDVVNNDGSFSGIALFTTDDVHMLEHSDDRNKSIDFSTINANRISTLAEISVTHLTSEAKMMFVEGLGFVYHIEKDNEIMLIASTLKGTNGDIFTPDNNGIVFVDENLLQLSKNLVEERNEYEKYLSTLGPGENPNTGASTSPFVVNNSDYNFFSKFNLERIASIMFVFSIAFAGLYFLLPTLLKGNNKTT